MSTSEPTMPVRITPPPASDPVRPPAPPEPEPQFTMWERFREYAGVLGFFIGLIAIAMVFMMDQANDKALNSMASQTVDYLADFQPAPAAGQSVTEVEIIVDYNPFNLSSVIGWISGNIVLILALLAIGYIIWDKRVKPKRRAKAQANASNTNSTSTP